MSFDNKRYHAVADQVKALPAEERRQLINLLHDMSCCQCQHYTGKGCALADGKNPPIVVQTYGCKNFMYMVPF